MTVTLSLGMNDLRGFLFSYHSYNTTNHVREVVHFSQCQEHSHMTGVVPGTPLETLETRRINTGMDCRREKDSCASCCSLFEKIMLMSREAMTPQ